MNISEMKKKKIPKRKMPFFFTLKSAAVIFYFIGILKHILLISKYVLGSLGIGFEGTGLGLKCSVNMLHNLFLEIKGMVSGLSTVVCLSLRRV